jgi:hypothetical protein
MRKVNLFILVAILCTSCSMSKILTSDVKPAEITEMLKIEPFSYISLMNQETEPFSTIQFRVVQKLY